MEQNGYDKGTHIFIGQIGKRCSCTLVIDGKIRDDSGLVILDSTMLAVVARSVADKIIKCGQGSTRSIHNGLIFDNRSANKVSKCVRLVGEPMLTFVKALTDRLKDASGDRVTFNDHRRPHGPTPDKLWDGLSTATR